MSDIGRLSDAVTRAGLTIYDKLNKADEVMQFQAGQQTLANMANQFDQQLATNPNHDKWMEDNETFQSQAFDTVSKTMKNQGAINALNTWWDSNKIERNKQLNGKIINARIDDNRGLLFQSADTEMKSSDPAEVKIKKLNSLLDSGHDTGILHPEEYASYKEAWTQQVNLSDLENKGSAMAFDPKGGPDAIDHAMDYMLTSKDFAQLSNELRKKAADEVYSDYNVKSRLATERTNAADAKTSDNLTRQWIEGALTLKGVDQANFQGIHAAEYRRQAIALLEKKQSTTKGPGPLYTELLTKVADPSLTTDQKNALVLEYGANGGVTEAGAGQAMTRIASGMTQSEKQGIDYIHAGVKGGLYTAEDELVAQNMLQEAIASQGGKASPIAVQEQAQKIKKLFSDKALMQAIDSQYTVEKMAIGSGGLFQTIGGWIGANPKVGEVDTNEIAQTLRALQANEFEGTYATRETQKILGDAATQIKKLIIKKTGGNPSDLKLGYDDNGLPVFSLPDGNKIRVSEKNGRIMYALGKLNVAGTIDWSDKEGQL